MKHVFQPETKELIKLYQGSTVFALPSAEEGFGVVIIEAMACGVPVVATRCGGPDGIIVDGKDGYLVPLDDAPSMADSLADLCLNIERNKKMGLEARASTEARFSVEVTGKALVDVWNRLLLKKDRY